MMRVTKHHGLGNDFLIVLEEENGPVSVGASAARRLCDRRRGIGADGLIVGARPLDGQCDDHGEPVDIVMHLWNADGSRAEMSGNGIRCLGQAVAMARDEHEMHLVVATDAGSRRLVVHDDPDHRMATVSVTMGPVSVGPDIPSEVDEHLTGHRYETVDMGNPHLVVLVDDVHRVDLVASGAWLERQFPAGVNVEYIAIGDTPDVLELRVWERGVGITDACGTGATAAAHLAHRWGLVGERVEVRMPGGSAEVILDDREEPILIGPSQHVITFESADV